MSEFHSDRGPSLESDLEEALTPRAKEMLSLLLGDLRGEVLESASRKSWGIEIGARDVIEAFEERTRMRLRETDERRIRYLRVVSIGYALCAFALTVLSVAVVIEANGSSGMREIDPWAIGAGAVAFSTAIASILLWLVRRRRQVFSVELATLELERRDGRGVFLDRWVRIESALRLLVANDFGGSSAELPLRSVFEHALMAGRIDEETFGALRKLLSVRNRVVHGEGVSDSELRSAAVDAARFASELEHALAGDTKSGTIGHRRD